jgi:hypothetical protein
MSDCEHLYQMIRAGWKACSNLFGSEGLDGALKLAGTGAWSSDHGSYGCKVYRKLTVGLWLTAAGLLFSEEAFQIELPACSSAKKPSKSNSRLSLRPGMLKNGIGT